MTVADIEAAEDIFGLSIQCLKGKTTRSKVKQVKTGLTPLPIQILLRYQQITLVGDVMQVNGIRFFVLMSRHINFITAQHIQNAKDDTLYLSTVAVNNVYKRCSFIIDKLHFDGEFLSLENRLGGEQISLNTTAENEHVG